MKLQLTLRIASLAGMLTALGAFAAPAFAAGPEVVAGPSADPQCFAPWTDKTKFFKYAAKKGPFRIALANGYIAHLAYPDDPNGESLRGAA